MNLRQHKRQVQSKVGRRLLFQAARASGISSTAAVLQLCLHLAQAEEVFFEVARVKDGVVVLKTKSREEADALIEKHARQKKAKLHLV